MDIFDQFLDGIMASTGSSMSSSNEGDSTSFYLSMVVFTLGLIFAILLSIFVSSSKYFHWLHESLAILFMGVIVGACRYFFGGMSNLLTLFTPSVFSRVFYSVLFPPVIFNAGFTLKKKNFMKNVGSIATYAIIGTLVSTAVLSLSLYYISKLLHIVELDFVESLMFGALLSPIDTVATIAVLVEMNVVPLLYSLVFGESVLNDAVAIALCAALTPFVGHPLQASTAGNITKSFIIIVIGSLFFGAVVGLAAAFMAARQKNLHLSVTFEMVQILTFAYLSYVIAELFELSGVISLFVCAVVMSHYCWYSVSEASRRATFQVAGALDYLSELLVFMSFGILLFSPESMQKDAWNIPFIVLTIVMCFVARACNIFILSFILNLGRKEKIPLKFQLVMWFCGMRGIVTLLLVLPFDTPNRSMLLNTTFVVIFFTNIAIGLTTKPLVKKLNVGASEARVNEQDPGLSLPAECITKKEIESRSWFARNWFYFDNKILKPLFGGRVRVVVDDDGNESDPSQPLVSSKDSRTYSTSLSKKDLTDVEEVDIPLAEQEHDTKAPSDLLSQSEKVRLADLEEVTRSTMSRKRLDDIEGDSTTDVSGVAESDVMEKADDFDVGGDDDGIPLTTGGKKTESSNTIPNIWESAKII